jgi:hypothetical protein
MIRGIVFLLIGAVLIVGGLSGRIVMRGTTSGGAIAMLGAVVALFGVYRLLLARKAKSVF